MKDLKQRLEELRNDFKERIIKGEFEVESIEPSYSEGYIGRIRIKIDEIKFYFSLYGTEKFVSDLSDFELNFNPDSKIKLKKLFDAYKNHPKHKTEKKRKIEVLKRQLEELQK